MLTSARHFYQNFYVFILIILWNSLLLLLTCPYLFYLHTANPQMAFQNGALGDSLLYLLDSPYLDSGCSTLTNSSQPLIFSRSNTMQRATFHLFILFYHNNREVPFSMDGSIEYLPVAIQTDVMFVAFSTRLGELSSASLNSMTEVLLAA